MERELLGWLPPGSSCSTLRIPRGKGLLTAQTLPAYRARALELAAQFAGRDLDVVAYGCTAAGFISGPAGDARLAIDLARVTGKPVVTTARAMVLAMQAVHARRIALVTPYLDTVNAQLKVFFDEADIEVRHLATFRAASVDELGRIRSDEVAELARQTMDPECDALFIACSQLPTFDIADALEQEFGRPVWSSIKATAWQARHAVNAQEPHPA
jgi:maleate cis-trans isomerase